MKLDQCMQKPIIESPAEIARKATSETAGKLVIVPGGAGMIGAAQVNRLGPRYQVVGFDRSGSMPAPMRAECVCVNVTSDESVKAGLDRVRYAYGNHIASVIHLAAGHDFSGAPSSKYEQATVRSDRCEME
jgi:UDP-glucose 4-epimerase